jgi:hypothetical protein
MITAQKTLHGDRDDAITWFQLDGEPVQIKVYEDPEVLAALQAHNVVIGKPLLGHLLADSCQKCRICEVMRCLQS